MIFSSTVFVFLFLPIVLAIYYLAKDRYRNVILLVASFLFYTYGESKLVLLMIFSIVVNWAAAGLIDSCRDKKKYAMSKVCLIVSIGINLGILFIFKYLDFAITVVNAFLGWQLTIFGTPLPIGISFYTFQAISYVVDVYRENGKAQKNVLNVGLYISFFPQLIAGPIVRYQTFVSQLDNRSSSWELFDSGVKRFICGFCKKVILANNLSLVAEKMFGVSDYSMLPVGYAWIGAIAYSLQIFYDFSGYSDMAIGLAKMFGFVFPENFNYPYMAKSVTDFWKRWHISLSQWFRDYIYIPLGGSRVSAGRHIFNMFVVWILTGLWHGANYTFILWGMIYFVFLVIEKYIVKPDKRKNIFVRFIWRLITINVIIFAWVFFNSQTLHGGVAFCKAMLGLSGNILWNNEYIFTVRQNAVYLLMGVLFSTPIVPFLSTKVLNTNENIQSIWNTVIYLGGFVWAVSFLVLGAHNPFIYFNF